MYANVEIKARLRDPLRVRPLIESLSDSPVQVLHQEDTFFRVSAGRLKLRSLGEGRGELILYHRTEEAGPKVSEYTLAPTSDPEAMRRILCSALGVEGRVRKERLLYLIGQTRVHLDRVDGLGEFLELEVVLAAEQPVEHGVRVARELLERLGIAEEDLVAGAYLDLLREGRGGGRGG
jgi:predicted adenylyl cyclase CyaB